MYPKAFRVRRNSHVHVADAATGFHDVRIVIAHYMTSNSRVMLVRGVAISFEWEICFPVFETNKNLVFLVAAVPAPVPGAKTSKTCEKNAYPLTPPSPM